MSLTLTNIQDFARTQIIQTDTTDLPNSLLTSFANEGVRRIINRRMNWPHLFTTYTLTCVADQRAYAFSTVGATLDTVQSIADDNDGGYWLKQMDFQEARSIWHGSGDVSGDPRFFAVTGDTSIQLFPKPDDTRALTVYGFRKVVPLSAGADVVDLPDIGLHEAVQYYVTAMAYGQQEDTAQAGFWKQMFEETASQGVDFVFNSRNSRPLSVNGRAQRARVSYWDWVNMNARG